MLSMSQNHGLMSPINSTLLAIEASTDALSIALAADKQVIEEFEVAPRQHNHKILPLINALMESKNLSIKDLDGILFSAGPGSFTGLRLAAGIAQGLALSADCPVLAFSSLQCLAQTFMASQSSKFESDACVYVVQDARLNEVYAGSYRRDPDNSLAKSEVKDALLSYQALHEGLQERWNSSQKTILLGNFWKSLPRLIDKQKHARSYLEKIAASIKSPNYENVIFLGESDDYPRASALLHLATFKSDEAVSAGGFTWSDAMPIYLRETVNWQKWQKKSTVSKH